MITSAVERNKALYASESKSKAYDSSADQNNSVVKTDGLIDETADLIDVSESSSMIEKINAANSSLNEAVKNVGSLYNAVSEMDDLLGQVLKNYPPFPAGGEDRAEFLKSFSSLRNLINKLTIPPDNSGQDAKYITEFKMPDLNELSTYDEIMAVKEKINDFKAIIETDLANIVSNSANIYEDITGYVNSTNEIYLNTDYSESSAEEKSIEIKSTLFSESIGSITGAKDQLSALLG